MTSLIAAVAALGAGAVLSAALGRFESLAKAAVLASLAAAGAWSAPLALRVLSGGTVPDLVLNWAVPGASFHVGLDALSALFLLLVAVVGVCAGVYGEGYLAASRGHLPAAASRFFFLVFIGSMLLLVGARNALLFMVAWETMALAAFGLVSAEHARPEVRRAGRLYLLCTHAGSLCLLALFALLGARAGSLDFDAWSSAPALTAGASAAVLLLALVGFGMKAGILPLHIWLQEAHPAAPSHASAAMSGVMIEMGLYGLLRLLSLLGPVPLGVSVAIAALGAATALFGILFALVQRDIKRLLAYSSIENVGIILLGLGLGGCGLASGSPRLALLGFAGALLHVLNHGLFKSLLFLSAGAVYQAAGTRDLEALGGLQPSMPWTGALTAVGAAAICGLPPLNGFTGEWLIYSWLLRPDAGHSLRLTALAAALLALVGALAVATLAKLYGLAFLGLPRSEGARRALDPAPIMLAPMAVLALLCLAIGVFPAPALRAAWRAAACVVRAPEGAHAAGAEEWSRLLSVVGGLGLGVVVVTALLWALRRALARGRRAESGPTWGCGFTAASARMQYTGSSFPVPAARVLSALVGTREELHPPLGYWPSKASFESRTPDPVLELAWPAAAERLTDWLSLPRRLQAGRLQVYLFYTAAFLVAVLLWKL